MGKVEAKLDYWEFTVPYDRGEELLGLLPGGYELRRNARGAVRSWRGYAMSADLVVGSGLVGWSPEDTSMGVHVSLSGQALAFLAGASDAWADLPGMVGQVHDKLKGHSTRLDVAFDDLDGIVKLDVVGRALREGLYTSRWKDWRHVESLRRGVYGETWYMGAPGSDAQLRIYDKLAERKAKGHHVDDRVKHWTRVELQLRRKRANAAADIFKTAKQDVGAVMVKLAGVVRGMVEFKERGTSAQKTRWPGAEWWLAFLGGVEKARLVIEKDVKTLDDVKGWVLAQVAPSLAVLEEGMGKVEAWAFLLQVAEEGHDRLGPRHRAILAASG